MKTIFDVLDDIQNKKIENGKIYRTTFADNGQMRVAITSDNPMACAGSYVGFLTKRAIFISFHDKEPGVITTRKHRNMQMSLQLILRDTYVPSDTIIKVEVLENEEDIKGMVDTVAGLRKTIEDAGNGEDGKKLILEP